MSFYSSTGGALVKTPYIEQDPIGRPSLKVGLSGGDTIGFLPTGIPNYDEMNNIGFGYFLYNNTNNLYHYAEGNPMYWIDPLGLGDIQWWKPGRLPFSTKMPFVRAPTNGNWGGDCWSGGQFSCGPNPTMGDKPPVDSADQCYMVHDFCYSSCGDSKKCKDVCDRELVDNLNALPSDPSDWPMPPPESTGLDTRLYRWAAIWYFS